jgi:hypothetical protein
MMAITSSNSTNVKPRLPLEVTLRDANFGRCIKSLSREHKLSHSLNPNPYGDSTAKTRHESGKKHLEKGKSCLGLAGRKGLSADPSFLFPNAFFQEQAFFSSITLLFAVLDLITRMGWSRRGAESGEK